jgi:hypothetical protein
MKRWLDGREGGVGRCISEMKRWLDGRGGEERVNV